MNIAELLKALSWWLPGLMIAGLPSYLIINIASQNIHRKARQYISGKQGLPIYGIIDKMFPKNKEYNMGGEVVGLLLLFIIGLIGMAIRIFV